MRSDTAANRVALLALLAGLVAGCQTATVPDPLTRQLSGNEAETRSEFWYQLARRPVASNDEAFHALLLYVDGTDPAGDYPARVAELKRRGVLPANFDRPGDEAASRGTLAVALCKVLDVKGGLTMRLTGLSPRYATRALEYRNLYPPSSPNQAFSGAEFVGVIGRVEDYQRGNPADAPAKLLPGQANGDAAAPAPASQPAGVDITRPLLLSIAASDTWWYFADGEAASGRPATAPATAAAAPRATPDKPVALKAIITGVEGDLAEVRKSETDPWLKARVGMTVGESAEFRTGPKSAIRFVVPPDHVYTLDRQGTVKLLQATYDGKKVTTDVGMEQGRVRLDVAAKPDPVPEPDEGEDPIYRVEEAGVEHDAVIRSPNTALAVRGTMVSLTDQPPFTPEAISLQGRALFRNTRRQLVAFGGDNRSSVAGDQSSAAEQALVRSVISADSEIARNDFETQETALLISRGGFIQGDVLVGNSAFSDAQLQGILPGELNFVLRWTGGPGRELNDLNLAVFSPLFPATDPKDFVANPPFTLSLNPGDPMAEQIRAERYPRTSPSGGRIGRNHVGPEGLEVAHWPENYPPGTYQVVVYNLVDALDPPAEVIKPVDYQVDVFLSGQKLQSTPTMTIGQLQTSAPVQVPVPGPQPTGRRQGSRRGR